jgi:hypothetical protein
MRRIRRTTDTKEAAHGEWQLHGQSEAKMPVGISLSGDTI